MVQAGHTGWLCFFVNPADKAGGGTTGSVGPHLLSLFSSTHTDIKTVVKCWYEVSVTVQDSILAENAEKRVSCIHCEWSNLLTWNQKFTVVYIFISTGSTSLCICSDPAPAAWTYQSRYACIL